MCDCAVVYYEFLVLLNFLYRSIIYGIISAASRCASNIYLSIASVRTYGLSTITFIHHILRTNFDEELFHPTGTEV